MKPQRHIRKETISILLVSNTGGKGKEIRMSRSVYRLLRYVPFVILAVFVVLIGLIYFEQKEMIALRAQLEPYTQQIEQQEAKLADLNAENKKLTDENTLLKQEMETAEEEEKNPYQDAPNGYPYMGTGGILVSAYSAEQPYMSINTHTDGTIVAGGDGTVTSVSSDDTYPLIVEIQHADGYITRYLSNEAVQTQLQEDTQVNTGDALFTITVDNTQFDYQIIYKNKPIDPLVVIEAKG
ncbi:MAG: peptidoglycan DD-metalloendopeptidase family protein [Lachnospiraceae bacterium]|nr:peptidoglycan DD-metalloendopeptidase family protein [Lachnospiraceae bacterium]